MPQLKKVRDSTGSVLVGVISIAVLMAIGAAGYMGIVRNTVNHEVSGLEDAQAFESAESGLLIGTRWLSDTANLRLVKTGGTDSVHVIAQTIRGMNVDVHIKKISSTRMLVVSRATGGELTHAKVLTWDAEDTNSVPGTIINDCFGVDFKQQGNDGISGLIAEGSVHFNTDIVLASGSGGNLPKFNGKVTVHSSPTKWGHGDGAYNNYDYGIDYHNPIDGTQLDQIFTNTYLHHQDSIYLGVTVTDKLDLPGADGTLQFLAGGGATYTHSGGTVNYTKDQIEGKALVTNAGIRVKGTVNGRVSVVTGNGADITIVGDLKYANDFTPTIDFAGGTYSTANNYGVATTDVISLVSANDIVMEAPTGWGAADYGVLAGMLHAQRNIRFAPGSKPNDYPRNLWFFGTRSAKSLDENFWNRGNAGNLFFLTDERFRDGSAELAGISVDVFVNRGLLVRLLLKNWTESNVAL